MWKNVNLIILFTIGTIIISSKGSFAVMFWGGAKCFVESVINRLKEKILTCSEEFENFYYTRLNLVQKDNCIYLDQQLYIDELKEAVIPKYREMSKESLLTTDDAWQLSGLPGQLNWTSSKTSPDMSFGACEVSSTNWWLCECQQKYKKI